MPSCPKGEKRPADVIRNAVNVLDGRGTTRASEGRAI